MESKDCNISFSDLEYIATLIKYKYPNEKEANSILYKYYKYIEPNKSLKEALTFNTSFDKPIFETIHQGLDSSYLENLYLQIPNKDKYCGISGYIPFTIFNDEINFKNNYNVSLIEGFQFGDSITDIFYTATMYISLKFPKNKEHLTTFLNSTKEYRIQYQNELIKTIDYDILDIPIKIFSQNKNAKSEYLAFLPNYSYKIKLQKNNFHNLNDMKLQLRVKCIYLQNEGLYFNSPKYKKAIEEIDSILSKEIIKYI